MKTQWFLVALGVGLVVTGWAQDYAAGLTAPDDAAVEMALTNDVATATNALLAEVAALQKRLSPAPSGLDRAAPAVGRAVVARQHAVAATTRPSPGAMRAAREASVRIELTATGAVARSGRHHVQFAANARTTGAVDVRLPDGRHLRSHVLGLCYSEWDSGRSVWLGEVIERVGEVLPPNQVIYRDVLDGVAADLLYTYTPSSFEQCVILRERLPSPAAFGLAPAQTRLAVLTEFVAPPSPRILPLLLDLGQWYRALGRVEQDTLMDETLSFGSMRVVAGRAFTLGEADRGVPVGKAWRLFQGSQGETRQVLVESTPYPLIEPYLERLAPAVGPLAARAPTDFKSLLGQGRPPPNRSAPALAPRAGEKGFAAASGTPPSAETMTLAKASAEAAPGVVLDYLLVNSALLNVEFGNTGKVGPAAIGQSAEDWWNCYWPGGELSAALTDLSWSDYAPSSVGLVVTNAPVCDWNSLAGSFCDPMYACYVHPTNNGHLLVTLTNLPADVYDLYVYVARASSAGASRVELKRDGTSLWSKHPTQWGTGWYAPYWEENEQYVRFRNVTVTNQTVELDVYPDASGVASLSGLQIVPSDALPSETPTVTNLLNVNFGGDASNKVGFAAVGLATNDYWNGYVFNYQYAVSVPNLRWARSNLSAAGLVVRNAPGSWGTPMFDPMLTSYKYAYGAGALTVLLTNLPAGHCDLYLYGHANVTDANTIFSVWNGDVYQGIKGSSLYGYGPTSNFWQVGQQYVRFPDLAVSPDHPLVIHVPHNGSGYAQLGGLQWAYTDTAADADADGLPDGWERQWFNSLDPTAEGDADGDGLSNGREYRLGLNPTSCDSDADGIIDASDPEFVWLDDATPQGAYQYSSGGDNWSWVSSWSDGIGWYGATLYPKSGAKFRVSASTTNTLHRHSFERAVAVIRPGTGDVLYAYVNLDPTAPPAEVMIEFYTLESNGAYSWNHRAYWGADLINWGVQGSASRYPMGDLPPAGQWVRLEIPASAVGLEGKIIEGIAFTPYSGRAAWDVAGSYNPDLDGDGWLDSIEWALFGNLSQTPQGDYDGDGLPNSLDAEPLVADTSLPQFTITYPPGGATF